MNRRALGEIGAFVLYDLWMTGSQIRLLVLGAMSVACLALAVQLHFVVEPGGLLLVAQPQDAPDLLEECHDDARPTLVAGKVLQYGTNEPAQGVAVVRTDGGIVTLEVLDVTDEHGNFRADLTGGGWLDLHRAHTGQPTCATGPPPVFYVAPTCGVEVDVGDQYGAPVQDALVSWFARPPESLPSPLSWHTSATFPDKTGPEGKANLVGVPCGEVVASVSAPGFHDVEVEFRCDAGPCSLYVALSPGEGMGGTLRTPSGSPIKGATIRVKTGITSGPSHRAGQDGGFWIPDSGPPQWVWVEAPGFPRTRVQVTADGQDLVVAPSRLVRVGCLGSNDLACNTHTAWCAADDNANGVYDDRIDERIAICGSRNPVLCACPAPVDGASNIVFAGGIQTVVDPEASVAWLDFRTFPNVVGSAPSPDCRVYLAAGRLGFTRSARSDDNGRFTFVGVPPGYWIPNHHAKSAWQSMWTDLWFGRWVLGFDRRVTADCG